MKVKNGNLSVCRWSLHVQNRRIPLRPTFAPLSSIHGRKTKTSVRGHKHSIPTQSFKNPSSDLCKRSKKTVSYWRTTDLRARCIKPPFSIWTDMLTYLTIYKELHPADLLGQNDVEIQFASDVVDVGVRLYIWRLKYNDVQDFVIFWFPKSDDVNY